MILPLAGISAEIELNTGTRAPGSESEFTLGTSFRCGDEVYAIIDFRGYPPGRHDISLRWFDPAGNMREDARDSIVLQDDTERRWGWLRLHAASGSGVLRLLDSSAGMEEFIGNWRVEIALDGEPVGSREFDVLC